MLTVKARQELERKVAAALIKDGLAAGYEIAVHDGEEQFPRSSNMDEILSQMFSVDEERLIFYRNGKRFGWVFFVYGNDGWDAINDHTTNLEHIMGGVQEIIKGYC